MLVMYQNASCHTCVQCLFNPLYHFHTRRESELITKINSCEIQKSHKTFFEKLNPEQWIRFALE